MNIKEIATTLNQLAAQNNNLKNFQTRRAHIKGLDGPRTYKIFSASTIFDGDDIYAFHDGGRSEFQFNIGVEYLNQEEIFRYGFAFSLEPNQTQPDPINFITPKIKAFNTYFQNHPGFFDNLILWHYKEQGIQGRSNDFNVSAIPNNWIDWGNFIFVGRYLKKSIDEINEQDLNEIIDLFSYMLPLFEYIESNYQHYTLPIAGERISRICWNDNGWVKPSGRYGKSGDPKTHEGEFGYGHEEWLGDIAKVIDGYHYGFLESIRKEQDTFEGKLYNVDLFAINGIENKRYLIGQIESLEVIDKATAAAVKIEYEERGWLQEMEEQIILAGANNEGFSDWQDVNLFNIRFKPEQLKFLSDYILIEDKKINDIHRYSFTYKTAEINLAAPLNKPFVFEPNGIDGDENDDEIETSEYQRTAKPIQITYLHKKIRDGLHKFLTNNYGNCVSKEHPTGGGTSIDVARKDGNKIIFYEIKTYYNLKACIREAFGQILEYAYWPGVENAHELIVVSQNKITDECKAYLKKLREKYDLPIYYQQFDVDTNTLSEMY